MKSEKKVTMNYPYVFTNQGTVISVDELLAQLAPRRAAGERVVTSNGCFDLLHPGHVAFLQEARVLGEILVVGLNSDASVAQLKGPGRPLLQEADRAGLLTALRGVDYVLVFSDPLPSAWLDRIQPDFHCKAGDYTVDDLPEAKVVRAHGGEICILPLREGFSTSALLGRMNAPAHTSAPSREQAILQGFLDGSNVLRTTGYRLAEQVSGIAAQITAAIRAGKKVLVCGNGGSAADAQHFAAELVGRYRRERAGWAAIALTADPAIMTSISNDYSFEQVYARQVGALGQPGDILVAITTSGKSPNILAAARRAKEFGLTVVGMTGEGENPLSAICHTTLLVPSHETPFIQQAHMAIIHLICEWVEHDLTETAPLEAVR